jgi:uncharacterized Zn-finger protein
MDSRDSVEIKKVSEKKVECAGQQAPSGHPKVFIDLSKDEVASCPYCGQKFVFSA